MSDLLDAALQEIATCKTAMTEGMQTINQIFQHSAAIKESLRAGKPNNAACEGKTVTFACPKKSVETLATIVEKFDTLVKDETYATATKPNEVGFEEFLAYVSQRTNTLGEAMRSLLSLENHVIELTEEIPTLLDADLDTF